MTKEEVIRFVRIHSFSKNLRRVAKYVKNDRELLLAAVKENGLVIAFVNEKFSGDKEVVLAAVNSYGDALAFASDGLKNDVEVVIATVKNNGSALQFASNRLRDNKKVVRSAIRSSSGLAYKYCSVRMQRDADVINLASNRLKNYNKTVDDFLCDELINLKIKYGVDTLEMALEIDLEVNKLYNSIGIINKGVSSLNCRL